VTAELEPVASIWATVELERALREHGMAPELADDAVLDMHLGANVVVIPVAGEGLLALAEPVSEGRLAASLARHGESTAGRYVAVGDGDTVESWRRRGLEAGVAITRIDAGPFGPSALLLTQPVTGPHLIVVERRSLPSPP
jgi:hypothetical protein